MLEPSTEVLERARALAPTIAAGADEIERLRRLPDTLTAALHRAGYAFAVCFELSRSSHAAPELVRRCKAAWDAAGPAAG